MDAVPRASKRHARAAPTIMPGSCPPSYASCRETSRSGRETVFAQPKGFYVGALIVAAIMAMVLGLPAWQIAGWIREALGGTAGALVAFVFLAALATGGFLFWRSFGAHLRREVCLRPESRELAVITHSLYGPPVTRSVQATEVQAVELREGWWGAPQGARVWRLSLLLSAGERLGLDQCTAREQLLPLAQALSVSLDRPISSVSLPEDPA